ncbi:HAMP domain-containing sensor histidine kinase [Olivibacter sitiensis]|uniref:HAMP domain-containing sensor histidine kinase n=1 Tax=Olivibacter sitiensis TaxID=376470 RepID=UPI00146F9A9D|nr:HAMP domain-containing sensor histidine kinase [Olivibacter sitiensis]
MILLMGSVFYFLQSYAFEDFYQRIEARVSMAGKMAFEEDEQHIDVYREIRDRYLGKLPGQVEFFYKVENGEVIDGNEKGDNLVPKSFLRQILQTGKGRFSQDNDFFAGQKFAIENKEVLVVVYANDPSGFRELAMLKRTLVFSFLVYLLIVYFVAKSFSRHIMAPIVRVNKNISKIRADSLDLRLVIGKNQDEITELSQSFNDMLDRLQTSFETQNNFIGNASHELKTPIAVISAEAELALSSKELDEDLHKSLQMIHGQAARLQQIIDGLLNLARASFNEESRSKELIRLDELLFESVMILRHLNPESKINFQFDEMPENENAISLQGNSHLLQLAFSNILSNACKYSDNKPVLLKLKSELNQIVVDIYDEGIGIPEQEVKHIFEPFFRASNTSAYEGYGVGLPLAQKIIRLHRGDIYISKNHLEGGEGTHIRVVLPSN